MKYFRERTAAKVKMLYCLSGRGVGASVKVKRRVYTAGVRSVLNYSAPCLPGLCNTSYQSLEVVQNGDPHPSLPDGLSPPPWAPPLVTTTKSSYARPKTLHPARFRQERLARVASCSTRATCLYYMDGSVGERGTVGGVFLYADRL